MDRKDRLFQLFSKNVRGTLERADADPDKIEEIRRSEERRVGKECRN